MSIVLSKLLIVSVRKIFSSVISFIELEAIVCKVETKEVGAWKSDQNDSLKSFMLKRKGFQGRWWDCLENSHSFLKWYVLLKVLKNLLHNKHWIVWYIYVEKGFVSLKHCLWGIFLFLTMKQLHRLIKTST